MTQLPRDWNVETSGSWVYLEHVDRNHPALEFELSDVDALAMGMALIRSSERARAVRAVTDTAEERTVSDATHGSGEDQQGQGVAAEGAGRKESTVEIRELSHDQSVSAVEAWLPGWQWPAVRAVQRGSGWLVFVDPVFSTTAGVEDVVRSALDAVDADEALLWVKLLAALYVKAVAK